MTPEIVVIFNRAEAGAVLQAIAEAMSARRSSTLAVAAAKLVHAQAEQPQIGAALFGLMLAGLSGALIGFVVALAACRWH